MGITFVVVIKFVDCTEAICQIYAALLGARDSDSITYVTALNAFQAKSSGVQCLQHPHQKKKKMRL